HRRPATREPTAGCKGCVTPGRRCTPSHWLLVLPNCQRSTRRRKNTPTRTILLWVGRFVSLVSIARRGYLRRVEGRLSREFPKKSEKDSGLPSRGLCCEG